MTTGAMVDGRFVTAPRTVYAVPPVSFDIRRTMDPAHLNRVANHPEVRPWLGGSGVLDLSALIVNPDNIALVSEHGGFLCQQQAYGRYEVHSLFTPDRPGAETIHAMRAALDYMFASTDCLELVTKVPKDNRAAAALALRAGFELKWTGPLAWTDGRTVEADFLGLSIERWALRSALTPVLGAWFHESLTHAKEAAGSPLPVHADDAIHDRMVGAAVLMLRAGNARKAVTVYNAWARLAEYATLDLVREHPPIVDVQDALIEARATEMEILRCV